MEPVKENLESHNVPEDFMTNTYRDSGKVAIFIALLSIVLLVVFFFGLRQSVTGLEEQVTNLASLKSDIADLDVKYNDLGVRFGDVEAKIAELEDLPEQAKKMVLGQMIGDVAGRAGVLAGEVDEEQAAKMTQAMELLQEVQGSLAQ